MNQPKKQHQRRGRPPAGKKAYTVRMPPAAYDALCRAAKDDEFYHLGDWLAQLPGLSPTNDRLDPAGRLSPQLARRRFVVIAERACALLNELYELVDYDVNIGQHPQAASALEELSSIYGKLKRLAGESLKPGRTGKNR